jgi:hypothetical protein
MLVANLQIKDVPPELHDELRRRAAQRDMTMRDYVLDLIRRDQLMPSTVDWLERVRSREPISGIRSADVLAEARAERERDLARALRR